MSHKFVSALILMAMMTVCAPARAQEDAQRPSFKLLRSSSTAASELTLEQEKEARWVPSIEGGTIEVSFFLGFTNLKKTLLAHDQIIYKYTEEDTYWGDVKIQGASAFCPGLRIGYNVNKWLCVEGISTVSFSEYSSSATNRKRRPNEPGSAVAIAEPDLGAYDLETRSLITGSIGGNAVIYPFNIAGNSIGRFHPFVSGGLSAMWYEMNSNFTDGPARTSDMNIGGGIRLIADRNISVRIEALFHHNSMAFKPAAFFKRFNEGTTQVPLNEYPVEGQRYIERPVTAFSSNSINNLSYSIGVQGTF